MALTESQRADLAQKLATAQQQANVLQGDISKARLAGVDTTDAQSRLTALLNQIRLLNLHYFNK